MSEMKKPICVRDLRLPTPEAIAVIESQADLTPEDKSWLVSKIKRSGFAGVIVDAHEVMHNNDSHFNASVRKLFCLIAFLSLMVLPAGAVITSSNMVTYAATGGASTNMGTPVYLGTCYLPTAPTFLISDGGTTTTNALTVYIKYGMDTNYYATVATYTKSATNATDATISPAGVTVQVYANVQIVTTNNVSVGAKAIITK